MIAKIYTFTVKVMSGSRTSYSTPMETVPMYDESFTTNIEADSLEAAEQEARQRGREFAAEILPSWWDKHEDAKELSRTVIYTRPPPEDPEEITVRCIFEDLIVGAAARFSRAVPDEVRYCPEHGHLDEWVYRGGKRYCPDCDQQLINIHD